MRITFTVESKDDFIGVDIDSHNQFNLLKTYFNASNFGIVTVEQTPSKGYHLKIYGNFTVEEGLQIRRLLGDDSNRIKMDEDKLRNPLLNKIFDTLFDGKYINGKLVKTIKINPLSEPFNNLKETDKKVTLK